MLEMIEEEEDVGKLLRIRKLKRGIVS